MKALLLDTETTGIGEGHHAVEVAVVLYDLRKATVLSAYSSLIQSDTNEAAAINRIPVEALVDAPRPDDVWPCVTALAKRADIIMAHRAEFDRGFVPTDLAGLRWVCSKFDIQWPGEHSVGPGLVHLALGMGLGVASAHRAMTDCDTLSRCLSRAAEMGHDLVAMVERAMRPKGRFQALVSYDDRQKAKDAGFEWDGARKTWERTMFIDDAEALSFKTRRIG